MSVSASKMRAAAAVCSTALLLAACGGGGGSTTNSSGTTTSSGGTLIGGVVTAPGGTTYFAGLTTFQRVLAALMPGEAVAASGPFAPVAGASVGLYSVNPDGSLASTTPLATTTTDANGNYSFRATIDNTNPAGYVVRVAGATGTLDARVAGTATNVDPASDATSRLVTYALQNSAGSALTDLSADKLAVLEADIIDLLARVNTTGVSPANISTALVTAAETDEELASLILSLVAPGQICGTVKNANGDALPDVVVVVRDYNHWVTRSKARTNTAGQYCAPVPYGSYVVGAMNHGNDVDLSASGWYTPTGVAYSQLEAAKVDVTAGAPVATARFSLVPGGRLSGTVASSTGANLPGILVAALDFRTLNAVAWARTNLSGAFGFNLPANHDYVVVARNDTLAPFASQLVGTTASEENNVNYATKQHISPAGSISIKMALQPGELLTGLVTDSSGAVKGTRVRVARDGGGEPDGLVDVVRTDLAGRYALWVLPGTYDVWTHGQRALAVAVSGNTELDFGEDVAPMTATVQDGSGNPIGHVHVSLVDAGATSAPDLWSEGESAGDGTVLLYGLPTASGGAASYALVAQVDDARPFGSIVFSNMTSISGAVAAATTFQLADTTPVSVGPIALPAGTVLTGKVTATGVTAMPDILVQLRNGSDDYSGRFLTTRTRRDGTYAMNVPAGTYTGLHFNDTAGITCTGITAAIGSMTTVNYYTSSNTCH